MPHLVFLVWCFVNLYVNVSDALSEGARCQTPNEESALCINIRNCSLLYNSIMSNPDVQFLKDSQCGLVGNQPLVCCGSVATYIPSLPDRQICGTQEIDKILNGEDTYRTEFPWTVLLRYRKPNGKEGFYCGGSLISKKYVLTAAHCVVGDVIVQKGKLVSVRLGEWNTSSTEDCSGVGKYRTCNSPVIDINVAKSIVHSEYDIHLKHKYHDIALLRLQKSTSYSETIRPICLPTSRDVAHAGDNVTVVGWGRTQFRRASEVKQKLQLPVVSLTTCAEIFREIGNRLRDSQLCAGGQSMKDSCRGDSGGPLLHTLSDNTAQYYIEGIVSFGVKCGKEGWPGVYTKVLSYVDWIKSNIEI